MEFCELTREEYKNFQKNHEFSNFLNSVETMDLEESIHLTTSFVGLKKENQIIAATPLVKMPAMKKFFYYYSPRGLLVDYSKEDEVAIFIEKLKAYGKKKKAMYIVIDPYVLYKERDIEGAVIEGGFNNQYILDLLKSNGLHHTGFSEGYGKNMQFIRWMFTLDLTGKTSEDVWKNLHQQTRWSINKTLKYQMKVRELAVDEMDIFYSIMKHTGERRNFDSRNLNFYKKQYVAYEKYMKVYLAYLDANEYLKSVEEDYQNESLELEKVQKQLEISPSKKLLKKEKVLYEALQIAEKRKKEILSLKEKHGEIIPMATSMFMFYNDEATYLTSGAYDEFMSFYPSYALQWKAINYAIDKNITRYNFYGISGEFDEKSPDYGVYKFKKGFGGQVEELIGDFEIPTRPLLYRLYKLLK